MASCKSSLLVFVAVCALTWVAGSTCAAQNSVAEFQQALREKAAFDESDFNVLAQGQAVVKILPGRDKREVAVAGLAPLQATAEVFLQSFRESLTRKSNAAILEIGSFSSPPVIDDLRMLTFDDRDIEDLKDCVVGDCRLKLSALMIDRLHKEVDWQAPDYQAQATQLLKVMLLEYVRDYLARGDRALIEYNDKPTEVRLAEEQRDLMAALGHDVLTEFSQFPKGFPTAEFPMTEQALVWSKIKFGLKPVIAINHITIYKGVHQIGPQILIASKQIYANHYFDSSLALTAFLSVPGASHESYLFYENRSRADGLGGAFGNLKRGIIENRAQESVTAILNQSQLSLEARALDHDQALQAPVAERNWKRWTVGRVRIFLLLMWIFAFLAFLGVRSYGWKTSFSGGAHSN